MNTPSTDRTVQPPAAEIAARLELALAAAREAGAITLHHYQRDDLEVEDKADASPVTIADRQSELHLRERIGKAFPADGILGEEFPEKPGDSGYRWILDPIDGTKSFIFGVPLYATLVGVEYRDRSVLGVIQIPALDECAYASQGQGTWYVRGAAAPRRARVTQTDLRKSLFVTSEVENFTARNAQAAYHRLAAAARVSRTWGDAYGYLLVATGRAAVMVDPKMNAWDAAAVKPIIEEAGGIFTDWTGAATIHGGDGIATNGKVHAEVLALLRDSPSR